VERVGREELMSPGLLEPGAPFPEFSLPAADNTVWTLRHLLGGRRTLLVFYRRDCPACRILLPFAERMYRRLLRADLRVAGVAQDSHADTLELADGYQITFPLLLDHPRYALSAAAGVEEVPTQILLDPEGRVLSVTVGFARAAQDQLFLRLARELALGESSLFDARDLIPDLLPGRPSRSGRARSESGPGNGGAS
jgi:peroxiredoxin